MGVGRYRHNCVDFNEKSIYQMSINKGITTIARSSLVSLVEFSIFFSFSLGEEF